MNIQITTLFTFLFSIILLTSVFAAENACGPMSPAEENVMRLQLDNDLLGQRIRQLESVRVVPVERLQRRKVQRLKEIAADARVQRHSTADFEGFVKWMTANLAGYSKYIQAGSYAAVVARVLPIPYAGQASMFTKFVAQFTLALNSASVAITNYLNSSQKFIAMTDAIDPGKPFDEKVVAEASHFADQKMLKDMTDAQLKLATVSDLSAGALSFLESVNHYISGTDEYWNRAKGVFKKDVDPKEKSYISESSANLKIQADRFNRKLMNFEELGRKQAAGVKALAVYDELSVEAVTLK
jgi:ABC-type multidrug transport system fused ATPase/permease subunit